MPPAFFAFDVRGQKGRIPSLGLGTATLFGDELVAAIRTAIKAGYRHFDTALLYDNQAAVGRGIAEAIAAGDVTRAELFVTTKVAFYPEAADGTNTFAPISFHADNRKGFETTTRAVDLCLSLLGLEYVDLLLIHNPLTALDEYRASCAPHAFELAGSMLTAAERAAVLAGRLARVEHTGAAGEAARAASWRALEAALAVGKAKAIGVSNYPAQLIEAMEQYAAVAPAVNQLELHPRCSWPALRALAARTGLVLTAYGSGNSARLERAPAVAAIAARRGETALAIVLRWTLARGVVVIPRTAKAAHIEENFATAAGGELLAEADLAALDALNEAHPYYWWAPPLLPAGTPLDL